jgi:hypothetical protein
LSALGASSRAVDGLGSSAQTSHGIASSCVHMTRAAHRKVRRERPGPGPRRSRGSGFGQDGLAVRTGQLRSTCPRLTRLRRRFRIDRQALVIALRGPAPLGASDDGPPAPRRLEQPSPCTSPISDVLRRHRGHRLPSSKFAGRKLCSTSALRHPLRVDPRDRDPRHAEPCGVT